MVVIRDNAYCLIPCMLCSSFLTGGKGRGKGRGKREGKGRGEVLQVKYKVVTVVLSNTLVELNC